MTAFEEKILQQLIQDGFITKEVAERIREGMKATPLSFEEYLFRQLKIPEPTFLTEKSRATGFPPFAYDAGVPISQEILQIIPAEAAQQYQMVPLAKQDDRLIVGMVDPTNIKSQQALRFILLRRGIETSVGVLLERDFHKVFSFYRGLKVEVKSALEEIERTFREEESKTREKVEQVTEVRETPVTKIVAVILKHAIEGNASDIHIEALHANTRVRFRVDGILYSSLLLPPLVHNSIVARIKILSSLRLDESRIPQDGRFSTQVGGRLIDFRVSTFPTNLGEKVVMRVLDSSAAGLDLKELGLVGQNFQRIEEALQLPFGMILVSGPTGSGKTTTLYAALTRVNSQGVNVVSLEDPIEYYIEGVSQSQTRPEINYTFASGLRSILRQDPDIIMVGEIRDSETAKLGIQAALTGHLVFSTIHTNNVIGVIPRLIDLGVDTFLIPSSVTISMAQRLVGRLCPSCKRQETPHPSTIRMIDEALRNIAPKIFLDLGIRKPYTLWNAPGCPRCNNKKTKGRIAIFEVLKMTDALKHIILGKGADALAVEEEALRQGMITMKQDGILKALMGTVSLEDVLRVVEEQI